MENETGLKYLRRRKGTTVTFLFIPAFLITYLASLYYFELFTSNVFALAAIFYSVILAISIFARFPLALSYDPAKYCAVTGSEPTVTITIPVFNEEKSIVDTVNSAISVDYPPEKIQVIVVNDGSTDSTRALLERFALGNPNRFTLINFERNQGKRAAMYESFVRATGEIIVTMDSDTVVKPNAIKEIVKPFVDSNISGVCGHVDVKGPRKLLERIQAANYFLSFHLYKKSESAFNSVICLSGPLAAYRKDQVLPLMDEWYNQTFLGKRCTFGDDRGLTTLLLRTGKKLVYTPAALAETGCPVTFLKIWKQRLRWKRSYYREMFWLSKFAYKKRKAGFSVLHYSYYAMSMVSPIVSIFYLFMLPFISSSIVPTMVYLIGLAVISVLYAFYVKIYTTMPISWMIVWWLFNSFVLNWGTFYVWFTLNNTKWMTR